jgi:hypothetical protein
LPDANEQQIHESCREAKVKTKRAARRKQRNEQNNSKTRVRPLACAETSSMSPANANKKATVIKYQSTIY